MLLQTLQIYFAKQSLATKLIYAIASPIAFFILCYALAQEQTKSEDYVTFEKSYEPFNIAETWIVWLFYVVVVGAFQYCIWQPPTDETK